MTRKIVTVMCIVMVCFSSMLLANGSSEKSSASVADGVNLDGYPILDTPTTFTIFSNYDNRVFDSSWAIFQEAADITNISLSSVISLTNSNEAEAYNLMVASGNLADVISYADGNELENLGRSGGLIDLKPLIEQYAPNIMAAFEKYPQMKKDATALDGTIYFIPYFPTLNFSQFYWIRADWLEKLGLEVPTTVDELHDVLYAFRTQDPNGNGLKDEIPLYDRRGDRSSDEYLQLWNSSTEFSMKDGKIVYDPLEEDFTVAVKEFAKWYAEGIVDPEFFTRGSKSRDVLLASNLGGFSHDQVSAATYEEKLQADIPGFKLIAIAPPISQNGIQVVRDRRTSAPGWGISSQCKNPVALIRYFDFWFTEEGSNLINWGIEGETYAYDENGEKYFLDNIMHGTTTPVLELRKYGVQHRIGAIQEAGYEYATMAPEAIKGAELYDSHPEWYPEDGLSYFNERLSIKILPQYDSEYKKIIADIRPYVDEMYQCWILGTKDFDSTYPEFCKELEKRGVYRAIEIIQESVDALNSSI